MSTPFSPRSLLATALAVIGTLFLALSAPAADKADKADKKALEEGKALAESIRSQRPARTTISKGTLRVRHADGRRLSVPVQVRAELSTNLFPWSTVYEASFPDGRRETLRVVNLSDATPHFVLHRSSGDGNVTEIRPQRPDEMFTSFAGTDFWFVDLGMTFLHWPEQRLTGHEIRRTRRCSVLESKNPFPSPGSYSRVVTWVDEETGGIIRAEAFDAKNQRIKEFSPGSFARVGSRYELRDMEIRNEQTDSRTTLLFEVDDPEKMGVKHLPTSK